MRHFHLSIDYKPEMCKKGLVTWWERRKIEKWIVELLELFAHKPYHKNYWYDFNDLSKKFPDKPDIVEFRFDTDNLDMFDDILYEARALNGVKSAEIGEYIEEDLI